ncbi:SirB2 family protein [Motiliproteus sp. SC1-56]|uniref:SirB2 family protein n=1 Tax=Motiliproteus sp. SC1-56 TaxID=2799565 RepID=UPI001A8C72C7|nr:SirB2 family protein [Motiliproteus sp. SC1-56]
MYLLVKHLHVTAVTLSVCFFIMRAVWMLLDSSLLAQRWVRILPQLIDSALLASAISLALIIQQYPFSQGWLTAKVVALLFYIGFGTLALRRGKTKPRRQAWLVCALLTLGYILWVARTHHPWPWQV